MCSILRWCHTLWSYDRWVLTRDSKGVMLGLPPQSCSSNDTSACPCSAPTHRHTHISVICFGTDMLQNTHNTELTADVVLRGASIPVVPAPPRPDCVAQVRRGRAKIG